MKNIILLLAVFYSFQAFAQLDGVEVPKDYSSLYNERGFYKSNAIMMDLNEAISEFNGNLNVSIPLFSIKGKGGMNVNLSLNYNGSMSYSVINRRNGNNDQNRIRFNAPGWVLSVNGIAVHTLNFETTWYSRATFNDPHYLATGGQIALLSDGYHITDNVVNEPSDNSITSPTGTSYGRDKIDLLMGDGSLLNLSNLDSTIIDMLNGPFRGEYMPENLGSKEKAVVSYSPIQPHNPEYNSDLNRILKLFRGDGTVIEYKEQLAELYLEPYMPTGFRLQQFVPQSISDNRGNTIAFHFGDYFPHFEPPDPIPPGYKAIGHPLLRSISIPGVDDKIEFYWSVPWYGSIEFLQGLVIKFQDKEYHLHFTAANGGVDFPLIPLSYPDPWPSIQMDRNRERFNNSAIAYVSRLRDPEGREFIFDYQQSYERRAFFNAAQISQGSTAPADVGDKTDNPTPTMFHTSLLRLKGIDYPDGRKSEFTYWEEAHAFPDPAVTGHQTWGFGATNLEDYYLKYLHTHSEGVYFAHSSPYMSDVVGTLNMGIGRDPYFSNMVYERIVKDGAVNIRKDRFLFDWANHHYQHSDVAIWPDYKGLDYQDKYYTTHTQFAYDSLGNENGVVEKKFTYQQLPFLRGTYFSPDVGSHTALKRVETQKAGSATTHEVNEYVYNGEEPYLANLNSISELTFSDYYFREPHFEKISQVDSIDGFPAGVTTYEYTLAWDSLNFGQVEVVDPLAQTTRTRYDSTFLPLKGNLQENSFYHNRLVKENIVLATSSDSVLNSSINEYYQQPGKTDLRFSTHKRRIPQSGSPTSQTLNADLETRVSYDDTRSSPVSAPFFRGETFYDGYLGFEENFIDSIVQAPNLQSVKLNLYAYNIRGNPVTTKVYIISKSWNPDTLHLVDAYDAPHLDLLIDDEGWYEIDLTNEIPTGPPYIYGIKLTLEDIQDIEYYGYSVVTGRYYPNSPLQDKMFKLIVNEGLGDEVVYQSFNGLNGAFQNTGAPGQLKSEHFIDSYSSAEKQTDYQYYISNPQNSWQFLGNLYGTTDFNGNEVRFIHETGPLVTNQVIEDNTAQNHTLGGYKNPAVPVKTIVYPGESGEDSLFAYQYVDALGLPEHLVDVNAVLHSFEFDKIGRTKQIVYPHDYYLSTTLQLDTSLIHYAEPDSSLKAYFRLKYNYWKYNTYFNNNTRIRRELDTLNATTGYQEDRVYLKFPGVSKYIPNTVQNATFYIYCNEVILQGTTIQAKLQNVSEAWDSDYSAGNPPGLGALVTSIDSLRFGWNAIDITTWVRDWLLTGNPENGLCFYSDAGDDHDYYFDDVNFTPFIDIAGQFSFETEEGYTARSDYIDDENRILFFGKQFRETGGAQDIIATQNEVFYDGLGRITEQRAYHTDSQYHTTTLTHNYADQVATTTNANGHTTETQYDFLNRPVKTIFESNDASQVKYTYSNALGAPVYTHDAGNDEIPPGSFFAIDTTIDESGYKQVRFKDAVGNLRREIVDPGGLNLVTDYFYNALYQLVRVKKPEGDVVKYTYNGWGDLLRRESPDNGITQMKYDLNSNVRFVQDANMGVSGEVQFTTYDGLNRPLVSGIATESFATLDGATSYGFETTTGNWISVNQYDHTPTTNEFPWNQVGNISSVLGQMRNLKGRVAGNAYCIDRANNLWQISLFSYDYRGRVEKKFVFTNGLSQTTISYAYNSQNQVEQESVDVGGSTFYHFYEYNKLGQLTKVFKSKSAGKPAFADVGYSYNPGGAIDYIRYNETAEDVFQTNIRYKYDNRERLTDIDSLDAPTLPFAANYVYHPNNNIHFAAFYNENNSVGDQDSYRYRFFYDNSSRMTRADYMYREPAGTWNNTANFDVDNIGYDDNGNILGLERRDEHGAVIDDPLYTYYSGTNRLQNVQENVDTTAIKWDLETTYFAYDANGNVETIDPFENSDPGYSLVYDERNLPVQVVKTYPDNSTETAVYRYNAAGQRIYKKVGNSPAEHYILDGDRILGVLDENNGIKFWNIFGADGVIGRAEPPFQRRIIVEEGWNLVSLPLNVPDGSVDTLFPNHTQGTLYGFDGAYQAESELLDGQGYFLNFPATENIYIQGSAFDAPIYIDLNAGWNLIGGTSCDVEVKIIDDPGGIIVPNTVFGFNGAYYNADTIKQGRAYWINASDSGQIILSCSSVPQPPPSAPKTSNSLDPAIHSYLTLCDSANFCQELYFDIPFADSMSYFAPPYPPSGAFDARFNGEYRAIPLDEGDINVQVSAYPLSITPNNLPVNPGYDYLIDEMLGTTVNQSHILREGEATVITAGTFTHLRLRKAAQ